MANYQDAQQVADIVFLLDVTGSMAPCIEGLKENISTFIDTLTTKDANNNLSVKEWRARIIGYRDVKADGNDWYVDAPFVKEVAELRTQLSSLKARGGGGEPESLLDAVYKLCTIGSTEVHSVPDPKKWRHRKSAHRYIIVFTDATYHPAMDIPEAKSGAVGDVINHIHAHRIGLHLFAPDWKGYDDLSAANRSEYYPVGKLETAQADLKAFTRDSGNFRKILDALAKSISKSASTEIDNP
ncbi:hypothetical protein BH09SUM1_BH09SUM1_09660 [soil metagenome]